jgi:hypothetical protein
MLRRRGPGPGPGAGRRRPCGGPRDGPRPWNGVRIAHPNGARATTVTTSTEAFGSTRAASAACRARGVHGRHGAPPPRASRRHGGPPEVAAPAGRNPRSTRVGDRVHRRQGHRARPAPQRAVVRRGAAGPRAGEGRRAGGRGAVALARRLAGCPRRSRSESKRRSPISNELMCPQHSSQVCRRNASTWVRVASGSSSRCSQYAGAQTPSTTSAIRRSGPCSRRAHDARCRLIADLSCSRPQWRQVPEDWIVGMVAPNADRSGWRLTRAGRRSEGTERDGLTGSQLNSRSASAAPTPAAAASTAPTRW